MGVACWGGGAVKVRLSMLWMERCDQGGGAPESVMIASVLVVVVVVVVVRMLLVPGGSGRSTVTRAVVLQRR